MSFDEPEEQSGIRLPTRHAERRTTRRVALDVPVLVDSLTRWETCQCHDVSVGGFALQAEGDWSNGSVVDVYFELPTGRAVETQARVVARSPGRTHLCFVALGRAARVAVESYIKAQSAPSIRFADQHERFRRVLPRRS